MCTYCCPYIEQLWFVRSKHGEGTIFLWEGGPFKLLITCVYLYCTSTCTLVHSVYANSEVWSCWCAYFGCALSVYVFSFLIIIIILKLFPGFSLFFFLLFWWALFTLLWLPMQFFVVKTTAGQLEVLPKVSILHFCILLIVIHIVDCFCHALFECLGCR